jgi:hypothetical protein
VLTSPEKWNTVKGGLTKRARALGTLAAVYASDERTAITIDHLRMALGVVKQGSEAAVIERYRLLYEGCYSVPTLPTS